jgi:hypothetical protein
MTATPCCFPDCTTPARRRDDNTYACAIHQHVHVATTGSWLDNHTREDD